MASENTTIDDAMARIPPDYRFYTADASIEGRVSVLLELRGQAKIDWHDMGKVTDNTRCDVRQPLYLSGVAPTLARAILVALGDQHDPE